MICRVAMPAPLALRALRHADDDAVSDAAFFFISLLLIRHV